MRKLIPFIFCMIGFRALAYQSSLAPSEARLRWTISSVPVKINNNSQTLSSATSNTIIQNSIAQWNSSMNTQIISTSSSLNNIKFETNFSIYGPAVVGVTEINYNSSGIITSANILLNEQNYQFTSSPGFGGFNSVYLGDVVSHELGHFLGLSHSEVLNSTMFYSNFPGQASLSDDDKAAVKSKYSSNYGKIIGKVKGGSDIGILGVHVQVISAKTGEIVSTLSREDGSFEISGLELGNSYYIYTSPVKNASSLPTYFINVQNEFCPSSYVGSFYSECGSEYYGLPLAIGLTSLNKTVNVGNVTINCSLRTQSDYNYEKVQSSFNRLEIMNYAEEQIHQKAYVGYFRQDELSTSTPSSPDMFLVDLRSFTPTGSQKYLKIQTISQALGNPLEFKVSVRKNGYAINGSPLLRQTTGDGTLFLDRSITIPLSTNTSSNIFEIDVSAQKLLGPDQAISIPDYLNFRSLNHWPYLLTLSITEDSSLIVDTVSKLSDNSACLDAPFAYSVDQAQLKTGDSTVSQNDPIAQTAASCGTIGPPSDGGSSGGLMSAGIGLILAYLSSIALKRKKNFLS